MLNTRLAVARNVTIQLVDLEAQIDAILVKQAHLQVALVEGRRAANLPLDAGQVGMDRMIEAAASLVAARKAIHAAHYDFRAVRDQLRLPVHAYGDSGDTPDSFASTGISGGAVGLALVDAA